MYAYDEQAFSSIVQTNFGAANNLLNELYKELSVPSNEMMNTVSASEVIGSNKLLTAFIFQSERPSSLTASTDRHVIGSLEFHGMERNKHDNDLLRGCSLEAKHSSICKLMVLMKIYLEFNHF